MCFATGPASSPLFPGCGKEFGIVANLTAPVQFRPPALKVTLAERKSMNEEKKRVERGIPLRPVQGAEYIGASLREKSVSAFSCCVY